jgi:hypothetical protein
MRDLARAEAYPRFLGDLPPLSPNKKDWHKAVLTAIGNAHLYVLAWRNGRRNGLKIRRSQGCAGSSPAASTNTIKAPSGCLRANGQQAMSQPGREHHLLKNLIFIVRTNFPAETAGWMMAAFL